MTQCLPPCTYHQYNVVSKEPVAEGFGESWIFLLYILVLDIPVCSGFMLVLVNSEVTEEREELLYDELSLVAELGGALGLFLGFSFLTVWDLAEAVLGVINKYMK